MTNPTARAIATIAASAGCASVVWIAPLYAAMGVVGIIVSVSLIWKNA